MQRLDSVDLDQLASSQGIHGFSLLASARTIPVCHQFISMLIKPFAHEPHSPTGQRAGEHVAGLDHDQCLVSGLARVEMRRWMIDEIHLNHDPKNSVLDRVEATGRGHQASRGAAMTHE